MEVVAAAPEQSSLIAQEIRVGSVGGDVTGSHPGFCVCTVKAVSIQLYVASDDKSIHVVCGYGHLHLGRGLSRLVDDHTNLLAVSD